MDLEIKGFQARDREAVVEEPTKSPTLDWSTVDEMWDFSSGNPMPRWDVKCHQCESPRVVIRHWFYHLRPAEFLRRPGEWVRDDTKHKERCDVSMKCTRCSLVFNFGVAVRKEHYPEFPQMKIQKTTPIWDKDRHGD